MAAMDFKPEFTVFKKESDAFTTITENRDLIRKNDTRRLHGNRTGVAPAHPRAETPEDCTACCEFYSCVDCHYLPLSGKWLSNAGFINGIPVKIRVMKDCIVITPQHTRELWGCLEGMSVVNINKQKVATWLKTFPGALNDLGYVPNFKRDK
ncbi:SymE family type I addiction module toxin [Enterobacter asburiae]|uniref:SymE family type I addiction module toxin n=1 Tax=Enterobacter TaxID=547 RepID=UPI00068A07E5|nr:SymE family type I addiction module toxin [Enterobacter asburiae]AVG35181.1 type I toxin-antitoxin system SymE family toxin [Enterobacter cloacae complex sp.]EHF5002984.1 type I toxin-antitoxin system SymE family toxin [Enterobacter asburiae]EJY4121163.1 SymE family type I addiction module toxin [Enterobacter asburiae]ELC7393370.1 SymE family type I addiction module toxin [Enterobacter asburiae]MBG0638199.1 type I addiction module toxin, SymE family [Enterobacter asburiae]